MQQRAKGLLEEKKDKEEGKLPLDWGRVCRRELKELER